MTKSRASALSISRRKFMAGTGVAGAALASNFAAPGILAQTRAPIRLGNLNSFTGAIAYAAEANLNAMNLYFDSIGWTVAGRKIEISPLERSVIPPERTSSSLRRTFRFI